MGESNGTVGEMECSVMGAEAIGATPVRKRFFSIDPTMTATIGV